MDIYLSFMATLGLVAFLAFIALIIVVLPAMIVHELTEVCTRNETIQSVVALIVAILFIPMAWWATSGMYMLIKNKPVERQKVFDQAVMERFILVDYNPPKHFYVTLKNEKTGAVYERVYVSKHCNSHRDNRLGDSYNIVVQPWHYEDKPEEQFVDFQNLQGVFCS